MTTLVINGNEYKIKYGYEATARCGVIEKVNKLEEVLNKAENMEIEDLNKLLQILPELLLAGLQKFHKDEFGYNYETEEGKSDALNKAYELVDDYFDADDADVIDLFNLLTEEMVQNGFLANLLQRGAEAEQKPKAPAKKTTRTTKKATA